MDRGEFSEWGLELDDEAFSAALAALGAVCALKPPAIEAVHPPGGWQLAAIPAALIASFEAAGRTLEWRAPPVDPTGNQLFIVPGRSLEIPLAADLAAAWRAFVDAVPWEPEGYRFLRLFVRGPYSARNIRSSQWLRPALGWAGSVFFADAFPSDGRLDWHWPFVIATLPGDPLAGPLSALQREKQNWPIHYRVAGASTAQPEVLVISAPPGEALARLLSSGLRLRCALVVLVGLGGESVESAQPLVNALVARLSAEGLAILPPGESAEDFAGRLNSFAYEITHNRPLDVALGMPFGSDALLLLNQDLLTVSRLDHALERATARLRGLPDAATLEMSPRSSAMLRLPLDAAGRGVSRAPDLADAIERARASYTFQQESSEASAITELLGSVESADAQQRRHQPAPRFLRQQSLEKSGGRTVEEQRGYVVGRRVMVSIVIGPRQDGAVTAPHAFPEDRLPESEAGHRLRVVFHDPQQFDRPMLRDIHLPAVGDSEAAKFIFVPRSAGPFEARISVLHRGRVLQTVLLRTTVFTDDQVRQAQEPRIRLAEPIMVREDWSELGRRRRFDAALVLNHATNGEARLTGIAGKRAWAKSLQGIETPVRRINDLISTVALSQADYGDGLGEGENPKLLTNLARVGRDLYSLLYRDQLQPLSTPGFDVGEDQVRYLQVISARPDALVPIEFMYDFNAPRADAGVCPQHRTALEVGQCPGDCPRHADPQGFVCPMGFWGVKKVIERHLYDPRVELPPGAELVVQAETAAGRDRLEVRSSLMVGHSQEVKADDLKVLMSAAGVTYGSKLMLVKDWDEWRSVVKAEGPTTLLAFPHNEGKEQDVLLEIGGKKLYTLDLPKDYVLGTQGKAPMVLLLGCDVAGTAQEFSNHIRYFRQAGAAVVLSTIATVFGPHAVQVGHTILRELAGADGQADTTIGEVLRDAKRAALLASVPMAMCVVAFGDADWRL